MLLRKEWELFNDITMTDDEWQMLNINFFGRAQIQDHIWQRDFGKWETGKFR